MDNINYEETDDTTTTTTSVQSLNYIYPSIRILALSLTGCAVIGTLYCSIWFDLHQKVHIVQSHQPEFLFVICFGILLWEISVIPYSIDDAIVSQRGCTIACIASQWLYNIGFTISFAGLYSKLWRINQIFHHPQFRRISVTVYDVLKPFTIFFSYTFIILLVWTIVDPPRWQRIPIDKDYTYGSCQSNHIGETLEYLLFIGHILVVLATIHQAYRARNISTDFSETWPLAIGLLNWIQLEIIGIPVQILIDDIVPSASYFLRVSILLSQSLTILFAIFLPLYLHPTIRNSPPILGQNTIRRHMTQRQRQQQQQQQLRSEEHRDRITTTTGTSIAVNDDSSIQHHDKDDDIEKYHERVITTINHTLDKSTMNNSIEASDTTTHQQVLTPIVESSSEMKDSNTSCIHNSTTTTTTTNNNNNNNTDSVQICDEEKPT